MLSKYSSLEEKMHFQRLESGLTQQAWRLPYCGKMSSESQCASGQLTTKKQSLSAPQETLLSSETHLPHL